MTHLSDFSFLQRMVSFGYLYVWYTYRVWTLDKFRCLHYKHFRQGELKSIVTLLILFMIPFQLFYDVTSVKIKYEEGFSSLLGRIFTKPEILWTKEDKNLVVPTEYSICIGFSLQTGTLVLLQCFWNYLANSVAKASFMSSKEFMFYIFWTFASFIIFPLLQYNFSRSIYDPIYKEIIPEMVYGIELFIVACLGVVSHFRFRRLLANSRDSVNGRAISHKIRYFQEINVILSAVLFGHGILLTILSCDGLTHRKTLNAHKFSADFFICNINMCAVITWFCMILIFHPKYTNSVRDEGDEFLSKENHERSSVEESIPPSQTFVFGDSQVSSDYHSFSKHSKAPSMIASQLSPANDSAFQFGPLPIPPLELNSSADNPYVHPYKVYPDYNDEKEDSGFYKKTILPSTKTDTHHKTFEPGMPGREEDSYFTFSNQESTSGSSMNLSNHIDMSDPYLSYPQPITKDKAVLVPMSGYKIERPMVVQPERNETFPSKTELDSFATYSFP